MNIFSKFLKTLTKPKIIITLIILTLTAAFIGVLVPQVSDKSPSYFEEWRLNSPETFYIVKLLQLNRVYTSVWFLILVFIILLSLGYSIYLQIKRNLKVHGSRYNPPTPPLVKGGKGGFSDELITVNSELPPDSLIKFMRKRRYKLVHSSSFIVRSNNEQSTMNNQRTLVFSKNSINRWGGTVFHSGLLLIIVAAIIGLSFQKRGFVQLMEGDVFSGRHDDFLVKELGVFQRQFDTGFKTHLSRFSHEYWDTDQIKAISSSIVLIDGNGNTYEDTLSPNHPVKYNGINIYQSSNYGYALSFALRSSDGRETVTHFMLDKPDEKTKPLVGSSDFPRTPYVFEMKFYPDISMNSFYLSRPILYLRVLKGISNVVFDGLIIPGDVINIEDSLLTFFNISSWSGLIYVKGFDMSIAYSGLFISCLGATIIFLLPHKEIFVSQKGPVLSLYGRTNRYKPLFEEEIKKIKQEIKEFIVDSSSS